jgi:hypothetical protein
MANLPHKNNRVSNDISVVFIPQFLHVQALPADCLLKENPYLWLFFLIRIAGGGVQLGPLGTAPPQLTYCTYPGWLWGWRIWSNDDWQGKPNYSEKTYPSVTLSTTNPTWPDRARARAAAVGSQRLTAYLWLSPLLISVYSSSVPRIEWRWQACLVAEHPLHCSHVLYLRCFFSLQITYADKLENDYSIVYCDTTQFGTLLAACLMLVV